MVLEKVLQPIDDPRLRVYVVWEPILGGDDEASARRAVALLPDTRVTHFWVPSRAVGSLFQAPLGLRNEPAWDVYLAYGPSTRWDDGAPTPDYFQHQLSGRLPEERRLQGDDLARRVAELLRATTAVGKGR